MNYSLDRELEVDGRWIAVVVKLPRVFAYGTTRAEAIINAETLALRVTAERLKSHESPAMCFSIGLPVAA